MKTEYDTNILRSIFNALPSMVFIVDEDVQIYEYNEAAANLLRSERNTILKHRAGDILHCIHSTDTPEGCGRASFCENCIIRNSVREAYKGKHIVRRRIRMELISKKKYDRNLRSNN